MLKRLICGLLALFMLFGVASCSADEIGDNTTDTDTVTEEPETTTEPEDTEEPFIIKEDTLVFVQNNISEYTIIRPESSTESNIKAASELQDYINKISGVLIPIMTDA